MKKGLILEGGAMRGLFSAGVTDVWMEHDIVFDGMIGVSAGAAFGCNYKSRQPGRTIRYNTKYVKDPRYCSVRSLLKTGNLYNADFCYHELPSKLDLFDEETFEKNEMEFYLVCTDVETGKPVYQKCEKADYDLCEWIRASASMPLVSKVVELDGYRLLDGGISDSIPLSYFESIGYTKNVVVLTQPESYVKKKNSLMPLMKAALRKYPKVVEALANRHVVYNQTTAYVREKEKSGDALVICPEEPLDIGRVERDEKKMWQVYEYGRSVGLEKLEQVRAFLE